MLALILSLVNVHQIEFVLVPSVLPLDEQTQVTTLVLKILLALLLHLIPILHSLLLVMLLHLHRRLHNDLPRHAHSKPAPSLALFSRPLLLAKRDIQVQQLYLHVIGRVPNVQIVMNHSHQRIEQLTVVIQSPHYIEPINP